MSREYWFCDGCHHSEREVGDVKSIHGWPSMCNACNERHLDIAKKALASAAVDAVGSPRQLIGLADEMIKFGMKAEARVVLKRALDQLT